MVFHGKRFSGVLAVAGLNADRYPSGGRGGYRRRISLVRATALGPRLRIPQDRRRRSDRYPARSSASPSNTSQYQKSVTSAHSVRHLLPHLSGSNRRRRVHAWETQSQALAIAHLTANSAFDGTTFRRRSGPPMRPLNANVSHWGKASRTSQALKESRHAEGGHP